MYYVPDGTEVCGFYECEECGNRFLSLKIGPKLVCLKWSTVYSSVQRVSSYNYEVENNSIHR